MVELIPMGILLLAIGLPWAYLSGRSEAKDFVGKGQSFRFTSVHWAYVFSIFGGGMIGNTNGVLLAVLAVVGGISTYMIKHSAYEKETEKILREQENVNDKQDD